VRGGLANPNNLYPPSDVRGATAAIVLMGGVANHIDNAGSITANGAGGIAILTDSPAANTTVDNTGVISGDIVMNAGTADVVHNGLGGVIDAPNFLDLNGGQFRNDGTLYVGGRSAIGTTTLNGDLLQSATGVVRIDVDAVHKQADLLHITGLAELGGTVAESLVSVRKTTTAPLIIADGGIAGDPIITGPPNPVFKQAAVLTGNTLAIANDADFRSPVAAASKPQQAVANYLQTIWDTGSPGLDNGFLALAGLSGYQAYADTLNVLSGQQGAAIATVRYEASQTFARDAFGCSEYTGANTIEVGDSCAWMRASGVAADHGAVGGFAAYTWRGRWCTQWPMVGLPPSPYHYAVTTFRRMDFGLPAVNIWFKTATPMAASVCCVARLRARRRGPISIL
jgi:hypothetical protein